MEKENLEWLLNQTTEHQYQLFQNFIDVAKSHYNQLMKEELRLKTGEKKEPVEVPRFYDKEESRTEEFVALILDEQYLSRDNIV